jgi:mRNA-degrading endonuclease RelE of RelBE toxin-antitoxin system
MTVESGRWINAYSLTLRFGLPSNPAGGNGQTKQGTTVGDRRGRGRGQALAGHVAFCTLPAFPRPSAVVQKVASVRMPYRISITEVAAQQLRAVAARDRRIVESAISARLTEQPATPTRPIRKLRSNPFAEFELRVQHFRVLYNVDNAVEDVVVLLIGIKAGNRLIVGGEEFHGHRSDPPQSAAE